jgi:protoporphyrinogen oxidase
MSLTRRDVLEAFLALPVAAAACRSRRPPPPGDLVFRSEQLGHRVRDGAAVTVAADRWERAGAVIVGAGVAGLSAAWRLTRAGFTDFVVVELDPVPGGTSKSGRSEVSAFPWGAHYVTAPMRENQAMIALLREAGVVVGEDERGEPVVAEQDLCRDPGERVFAGGSWTEGIYPRAGASAEDLAQLAAFEAEIGRWASWRDGRGRRAFAIPVAAGSDDAEVAALDRISMAEWLDRRGLRSRPLRWLVDYACRDDYGAHAAHTSAWAGVFYFASRMRAAGSAAQPVVTWPEGNGRLVRHLVDAIGPRLRLGLAVTEVVPTAQGVDAIALNDQGQATGLRASHAILAVPQLVAARVLRDYRDGPPPHVAEFEYGAWMVANLHVRARPASRGFPFAWDSVIVDSPSLGYVTATHQRGLDHGPTVLTYYYALCDEAPRAARERLLATGRDEWAEVALADLATAHPDIRDVVTRIDVVRWGHAMVRPRPGFVFGGARARASEPHRGVHFASTDLSGVALFEEAFYHGVRAAEAVLAARGVASPSIL